MPEYVIRNTKTREEQKVRKPGDQAAIREARYLTLETGKEHKAYRDGKEVK